MADRKPLRRRLLAGAAVIAGATLLWALAGAFLVPALAKPRLERALSAALGRPVSIGRVSFHPFTLTARIVDLRIADREPGRTLLSVRELLVDAQLSSAWHRGLVAREVRIDGPRLWLARTGLGTYNISDLLAPPPAEPAPPGSKEDGTRFSLNNIRLRDGRIDFDDRPLARAHVVDGIALDVPFISNLPVDIESFVTPALSATANGTPFQLTGRTRPFLGSQETVFELKLVDFDAAAYVDYLPRRLAAKVDAARLDVSGTVSFARDPVNGPALLVAGRAALRDLATRDAAGRPLLSARRLDLELAKLDAFRQVVEVRRLAFDAPSANVIHTAQTTNILDLVPEDPAPAPDAAPVSKKDAALAVAPRSWQISIGEIRLSGGRVAFTDEAVRPRVEITLDPVDGALRDWVFYGTEEPKLSLNARATTGEAISHEGTFRPFPKWPFSGTTAIRNLPAARLRPYVAEVLPFDLARGTFAAVATCRGALLDPLKIACSAVHVAFDDLRLGVKGGPDDRVVVRRGEADLADLSLETSRLRVARLAFEGARAQATRTTAGIDLVGMFLPPTASPPPAASPRPAAGPGWTVDLDALTCRNCGFELHDLGGPQPVELALGPLALEARGLSTTPGTRGTVDARGTLGGGGSVSMKGRMILTPFELDAATAIERADLVRLQGYFTPIVRLVVADGALTGKGRLAFKVPPTGDPVLKYEGDANFVDVVTTDADLNEELFSWSSLYFDKLRIGYNPFFLEAASIAATDARGRLSIEGDGSVNLYGVNDALRPAPEGAPAPPPPGPDDKGLPVRIDAITVLNGQLKFEDHTVDPSFDMPFSELNGAIRGLSSEAPATVELRGRLGAHAPVEITGRMNPLSPSLFADIKIASRDVDLSPWSPYSGRWLGWTIASGTLSTELSYLVDKRLLDAKHRIVIDQLTFGDRVQSKDRIRLPIKTAVALLKDRDGRIDLDVPVSGSIDDPQFRVWPIVWKMVKNVFSRAGSAPFSMFKGVGGANGDELSFLEFAPGRSALDETAAARLGALAANLAEKPALRLQVSGFADPERDREGLKRLIFERKVKARKAAETGDEDATPAALDALVLSDEEFPAYLKQAYRKEKIPKPRTALGLAKDLPPADMEQLMLTSIAVGDEDLRRLAGERAAAARERLVANGVDAARVSVLEPEDWAAPSPGKGTGRSLVEFTIVTPDKDE